MMAQQPVIIVSERMDGTMQLVAGETALDNRDKFLRKQKIDPQTVVSGQLVNGARVAVVKQIDGGSKILNTDGLVTTDPSLWLSITVADCLPIVVYGSGVVALLHGGWRGLNGRILEQAVSIIRAQLKIDSELSAYIGPGIDSEHYEVKDDVKNIFDDYPKAITAKDDKYLLDLRSVARAQLNELGIKQIEESRECTYCSESKYFSARRDRVKPVEAMMVLARIR